MNCSLSTPIVKPINGKCNLSCDYCYMDNILEPQKSNFKVMDSDTLRATIDFFCSRQNEIEFIWHGGEPLLAGKNFYRNVVKFQNVWISQGKKITNFIQTNGTLVDEEWAATLAELNFCVGVSLDAPQNVHDKLRKTKEGSSSFKKTIEGISALKKFGIFNGVSCCVGKTNFNYPKKIIDFFLSHEIKSLKFLRIKDNNPNNAWNNESISADQYADFLIKIFKIWLKIDDPDLEIRDIKSIVDILLGGNFRECANMGKCDQFVTVYNDGSIFACDSFPNETKLKFGTVFDSYSEIINSDNFQIFLWVMEKIKSLCQKCQWYFVCKGGCLRDRYYQKKLFQIESCEANQKLFKEIKNTLLNYNLLTDKISTITNS